MYEYGIQRDSAAWRWFVNVCFYWPPEPLGLGIYFLPTDYWVKGYMDMGALFLTRSPKIINQIQKVKTEKMLKKYDQK